MSRTLLMLMSGPLTDNLSGPEIRAWELATALARKPEFEVTLAAPGAEESQRDGLRVIPRSRRRLLREVVNHDIVVGTHLPAYLYPALVGTRTTVVADLYDPMELEHAEGQERPEAAAFARLIEQSLRMQLRFATLILCASQAQRERLEGLGFAVGRDPRSVVLVPYGLGAAPPAPTSTPLRDRFPALVGRPIVLWWGGVWRWFDALTAVRAFAELRDRGSDAALVIAAGNPPRSEMEKLSSLAACRDAAENAGLLDSSVFIFDTWVPYAERHNLLAEARVGLTLHRATEEAPFAARARYLDYLWTGLPGVLNGGDEMADHFEASGFARIVPVADPSATADALEAMLHAPQRLQRAREVGSRVADEFRWESLVEPLARALNSVPEPPAGVASLPGEVLRYGYRWSVRKWTAARAKRA